MPFLIEATIKADVTDFDGTPIKEDAIIKKLNGLCCADDTAINYLDEIDAEGFRGGYLRLIYDESKRRLNLSIQIDSPRKLNLKELKCLRENLEGQMFDGIGSGAFNELGRHANLQVSHSYSAKVACKQSEGKAWKPIATTVKSNERKIQSIAKAMQRLDDKAEVKVPASKSSTSPEKKVQSKTRKINYKKLLRLLDKVDREFNISQIEVELQAIGSDLSGLEDRQFPTGNFQSAKLLKILLKAGLPPDAMDSGGHPLLYQAAPSPPALKALVKLGVDVNRQGEDVNKMTALMRACHLDRLKSVEVLLALGARPNIKDAFGRTALEWLDKRSRNKEKIAAMLKKPAK